MKAHIAALSLLLVSPAHADAPERPTLFVFRPQVRLQPAPDCVPSTDGGAGDAGVSCTPRNADIVTLSVQPRFATAPDGEQYAMVWAVPAKPLVSLAPPWLFNALHAATDVQVENVYQKVPDEEGGTFCDDPPEPPPPSSSSTGCGGRATQPSMPSTPSKPSTPPPMPPPPPPKPPTPPPSMPTKPPMTPSPTNPSPVGSSSSGCSAPKNPNPMPVYTPPTPSALSDPEPEPRAVADLSFAILPSAIGPYEMAVLDGADANTLDTALLDRGFRGAPDELEAIRPYVAKGWYVVALRMRAGIIGPPETVSFTYESSELRMPAWMHTDTIYVAADTRYQIPSTTVAFAAPAKTVGGATFITRSQVEVAVHRGDRVAERTAAKIVIPTIQVTHQIPTPIERCPTPEKSGPGCAFTPNGAAPVTGPVNLLVAAGLLLLVRYRRVAKRETIA
jgi:hypothetical protein